MGFALIILILNLRPNKTLQHIIWAIDLGRVSEIKIM